MLTKSVSDILQNPVHSNAHGQTGMLIPKAFMLFLPYRVKTSRKQVFKLSLSSLTSRDKGQDRRPTVLEEELPSSVTGRMDGSFRQNKQGTQQSRKKLGSSEDSQTT